MLEILSNAPVHSQEPKESCTTINDSLIQADVSTQTEQIQRVESVHVSTQTNLLPKESLHDRYSNKGSSVVDLELDAPTHDTHMKRKNQEHPITGFVSASEKLAQENTLKKGQQHTAVRKIPNKKTKFISPLLARNKEDEEPKEEKPKITDDRLKNIDPPMVETICNEIMEKSCPILWDDIAGLEHAKKSIQEIVVWPMLRPDLFFGIRGPPKGIFYLIVFIL